jgi:hypothetical protein
MHAPVTKAPRASETYRGARRNGARALRKLPEWRASAVMAIAANDRANLQARRHQANAAREAASKALIQNSVKQLGLRHEIVAASALLQFYRGEKRTRPVNRIIRELERQVRA